MNGKDGIRRPLRKMASSSTTTTSLTIWAEDNDISATDLAEAYNLPSMPSLSAKSSTEAIASSEFDPSKTDVGRYIAIDCEMVGVGGEENERSALARVSIVNYHGHLILDTFVKPKERVTNWRTWVSGVSAASMKTGTHFIFLLFSENALTVNTAITYEQVQQKVSDILQRRILVGHAVKNDLEVLLLSHPKRDIRDTSRHPSFRKLSGGKTPGLKKLAKEILGIEIQGGEHSSVSSLVGTLRSGKAY